MLLPTSTAQPRTKCALRSCSQTFFLWLSVLSGFCDTCACMSIAQTRIQSVSVSWAATFVPSRSVKSSPSKFPSVWCFRGLTPSVAPGLGSSPPPQLSHANYRFLPPPEHHDIHRHLPLPCPESSSTSSTSTWSSATSTLSSLALPPSTFSCSTSSSSSSSHHHHHHHHHHRHSSTLQYILSPLSRALPERATCGHLRPTPSAATRSHLQSLKWLQVAAGRKWPRVAASGRSRRFQASGRKWPQAAASGRKWLLQPTPSEWPQVAAFGQINFHPQSEATPLCNYV